MLCPEFGQADDAVDKLDVCGCEQVFVLALRVLDKQRDWVDSRVDDWVCQGSVRDDGRFVQLVKPRAYTELIRWDAQSDWLVHLPARRFP